MNALTLWIIDTTRIRKYKNKIFFVLKYRTRLFYNTAFNCRDLELTIFYHANLLGDCSQRFGRGKKHLIEISKPEKCNNLGNTLS